MTGLVAAVVVTTNAAWGCSCRESSPDEALGRSDAAVLARVVEVTAVETPVAIAAPELLSLLPEGSKGREWRVILDVAATYRGTPGKRMEVFTAHSVAACGVYFRPAGFYVVFADREHERWTTGRCAGTVQVEGTHGDLKTELASASRRELQTAEEACARGGRCRHFENLLARRDDADRDTEIARFLGTWQEECRQASAPGWACERLVWWYDRKPWRDGDVDATRVWADRLCELGDASSCRDRGR